MKKLNIDLELLVQSFSFNDYDLGKEYLDTHTGDIINIPSELNGVVQGENGEEDLESWQKDLLKDAYSINNDTDQRYIIIPNIEESYFHDVMVNFSKEEISSEYLKEELLNALESSQPTRNFKNIIFSYEEETDKWQDYEDEKAKEYAVNWLSNIGIEVE
ncbi:UPF0158 family protein [Clostridium sp. DJ247]|uniref:UPF0158 family protein n=1 Tax=Clostridium sp. DJ247 TaxID=2726188 RepID=UPI0016254C15|nr:UPF0158 family protein [Clostridium sp. DJ247]MBC2581460.1 hypothetical protein [Clostridium sp. DJ247]